MISIRDLRVDYDHLCAVNDLSLEVEPGEVCGLIGPNGAGKTTTMRTMLGLIEPTYGEIEIMGIDAFEEPEEVGRLVGFMPDFPPIYDDLLVWEFLDLFAASYRIPRRSRPELIDRYLEIVGLTPKRDAPTIGLSRGMRQRLMLAKTLIPNPQVLLLDEPASGVDPQGRIDLKSILKRLASDGKTILISSHILAEMNEFCTSVAIMERGRLVESGRIEDVNARIMGDSALVIEILGDPEACLRMLSDDPRAGTVRHDHGSLVLRYPGGPEEASELLARLVSAGVRVVSFARRKDNLEELFLKVGARELS
jgi:ABC-2 type transport system ATP-binding protein